MEKITFKLRPTDEYIELVKLLKLERISQTGGHAKIMIEEGAVKLNGELEFRKRKKLRPGDIIEVEEYTIKIIE